MAEGLVCNRAPGACRVNASEICERYDAEGCFLLLLLQTDFSSLLAIPKIQEYVVLLF